jgi:hypothetical protein
MDTGKPEDYESSNLYREDLDWETLSAAQRQG